jgi:hypothetical protein
MNKVEKDPNTHCWVFTGHWHASGFGIISVGNKCFYVRKVMAWIKGWCELWDGVIAHRKCRTEACCNPRHIQLATTIGEATSNMFDRGLFSRKDTRMSAGRCRCVRILLSEGYTIEEISEDIGIKPAAILSALYRERRRRRRQKAK